MQTMMLPVLPSDTIDDLYPRYAGAWDVVLLEASARHLLTLEEFREEMVDPRLEKHVVLDEGGRVVAMTTMTTDLDAIPWINPAFYQHRFPDKDADGTLYYLGYTFVDLDHRRTRAFALMAEAVNTRLSQVRGVIGFDICGFNLERGVGRRLERLFSGSNEIIREDTQTYFVADYRTPRQRSVKGYLLTSLAERPALVDDVQTLLAKQWPVYTLIGDAGHGVDLEALLLRLPEHQLLFLDEQQVLCGVALSLPLLWDGTAHGLPAGWDDAIVSGERLLHSGGRPDTLCALSITVAPSQTRRGLAEELITALKKRAAEIGAHSMIAPVRPADKARYPLIPLPEYLTWTRPDGQTFDPWLRVHLRLGGEVSAIAPESMVVAGTVAEWESWLGTPLPGTGDYVIDGGLAPLQIDRSADRGVYVEPNVWVSYRINE
jgi:GNAT superfamily N-acetyltransferase